jgi:hypothetical protein
MSFTFRQEPISKPKRSSNIDFPVSKQIFTPMKRIITVLILSSLISANTFSQVGINADNSAPNASAMLDVKSTSKGFLLPRMTRVQRNAIATPPEGMMVYCTNCGTNGSLSLFINGAWTTLSPCSTAAPAVATHALAPGQVTWNWQPVAGASGYKWNTTANYETATQLTQSTVTCWVCGTSSVTVNHAEGNIAPYSITINYGTATNVPGETSKCWITKNLGANLVPDSPIDIRDSSAGWYWQFNRKQGFTSQSGFVSPYWTIYSIVEMSDWQVSNDPCTSELGAPWRIPTLTEWQNVKTAGVWSTYNEPWASPLGLHCAGYLASADGHLFGRGASGGGYYLSSSKYNSTDSWAIRFRSYYCFITTFNKANGSNVRCIRE